jgi:hypothetical protein
MTRKQGFGASEKKKEAKKVFSIRERREWNGSIGCKE